MVKSDWRSYGILGSRWKIILLFISRNRSRNMKFSFLRVLLWRKRENLRHNFIQPTSDYFVLHCFWNFANFFPVPKLIDIYFKIINFYCENQKLTIQIMFNPKSLTKQLIDVSPRKTVCEQYRELMRSDESRSYRPIFQPKQVRFPVSTRKHITNIYLDLSKNMIPFKQIKLRKSFKQRKRDKFFKKKYSFRER